MSNAYQVGTNEFILTTDTAGDQEDPSVVALDEQRFVVIWDTLPDDGSDSFIEAQIVSSSGALLGATEVLSDGYSGDNAFVRAVSSDAGAVFVFWEQSIGNTLEIVGGLLGTEDLELTPLDGFAEGAGLPGLEAKPVPLGETEIALLYDSLSSDDVVAQLQVVEAGDGVQGPPQTLQVREGAATDESTGAALRNGGLVAVWSEAADATFDDSRISIQFFDAQGTAEGPAKALSGPGLSGEADDASVAELPNGTLVVAWEEGGSADIFYQRLSGTGDPLADPVEIPNDGDGPQSRPIVTALPTGGFNITWTDFSGQDGSLGGVFTRFFDADGTPATGEIIVNQTTNGEQDDQVVTLLPDGRLLIAWEARERDGDGNDIFARLFVPPGDDAGLDPVRTIPGTTGPDTLPGTDEPERFEGLAGDDLITGQGGNDVILGGPGADVLFGQGGADQLFGGEGRDQISGGPGDDEVFGGAGDDILTVDPGTNTIDGGDGEGDIARVEKTDGATRLEISTDGAAVGLTSGKEVSKLIDVELLSVASDEFGGTELLSLDQFTGIGSLSEHRIADITELYIAYFDRAPDALGLAYWGTRLAEGMSIEAIAESFFVQPETQELFPNGSELGRLVDAGYQNLFERDADPEGRDYWIDELSSGSISVGEFMLALVNGARANPDSSGDVQTLDDKLGIALTYAAIEGLTRLDGARSSIATYDRNDRDASLAEALGIVESLSDLVDYAGGAPTLLAPLVGLVSEPFDLA